MRLACRRQSAGRYPEDIAHCKTPQSQGQECYGTPASLSFSVASVLIQGLVDNEHEVQELLTLPAENKINRLKKRNSKVLLVSRYAIFLESASSCVVCKRSHKTLTPLFARRTPVCHPKSHTGCRKGSQWPSERDRESNQQHLREQSSQRHKMNTATTLHTQSSFILLCVCSSAPPSVTAKY